MSSSMIRVFARAGLIALALAAQPLAAHETGPAARPLPDTHAPAGVLFDHMHRAGEFMLGYRFSDAFAAGPMLRGADRIGDQALANSGFGATPRRMTMPMHMLDVMVAPTDWLNLMVMPQLMGMDMAMRELPPPNNGIAPGAHAGHGAHDHGTFGIGDTVFGALVRLYDDPVHHLHLGTFFSAPTGSVSERDAEGRFVHYGMQLGSGTWDFLPSITYTGRIDRFGWGAQVSGVVRLEKENASGFRFGDQVQATAWGSYRLADAVSASLRVLYTAQGPVEGHYSGAHNHASPPDLQANYGGQFLDVGVGLNAVVREGWFTGHRLGVEWLQPVVQHVNGVQLKRTRTLFATWSKAF